MTESVVQAASILAPVATRIAAISVTATSAGTDLSATNQLGTDLTSGKGGFITLIADGADVYVAFGETDPAAIDETNVTAGNAARCWLLKDGVPQHFSTRGVVYVEAKTVSGETATLRAYLSGRLPTTPY